MMGWQWRFAAGLTQRPSGYRPAPVQGAERGFTLFETLVALAVLAMVSAAAQLVLSGGWRGLRNVEQEKAALSLAQAELASAGVYGPIAEGVAEGETADGFAWTREVRRHVPPDGSGLGPVPAEDFTPARDRDKLAGFWVTVTVRWSEGPRRPQRSVVHSTLKIGRDE